MTLYLNGTTGVSGVDGSAGTPSLQGNDTNTGIVFGTDTVGVSTGGVQRTTVDSSGRLLVGVGSANANGGVLQLSGGITFPGTQVAVSDVNTLDDYEEGTWTPDVSSGYNFGATVSYTSRSGSYTKIGRLVVAAFHLEISSVSGGGGPIFPSGLPFLPANTSDSRFQSAIYISGPNTPATPANVLLGFAKLDNGSYYLTFNCPSDNVAMSNALCVTHADLASGDVIGGTFTYFV